MLISNANINRFEYSAIVDFPPYRSERVDRDHRAGWPGGVYERWTRRRDDGDGAVLHARPSWVDAGVDGIFAKIRCAGVRLDRLALV